MVSPSRSRANRSDEEPVWRENRRRRLFGVFPRWFIAMVAVAALSAVTTLWLERLNQTGSPYVHSLESQIALLNRKLEQSATGLSRQKSQLAANEAEIGRLRRLNSNNEDNVRAIENLRSQVAQLKSEARELRMSLAGACERLSAADRQAFCR